MQEPERFTETIRSHIDARRQVGARTIVAIDGRCAAGKTTLAARLGDALNCGVLHMDDFFLRPKQRTDTRLATPGGNVDYERFRLEVLEPLLRGEAFAFRPYDCHSGAFRAPVEMPAQRVAVIEGAYCCHPALRDAYDLTVFLSVEPGEQLRRIRQRNGEAALARFSALWIPLEEDYFAACHVREQADIYLLSRPFADA